jgi:cysteine desulfurase
MDKIVYVDHNATTYVEPKVLNDMLPYFTEKFGNASSNYLVGRVARAAVQKARGQVAKAINCNLEEIYFTSGASESNNLILLGIARANKHKGKHIITSKIEHR